jgi:SAM-dependent methyltransferase
VNLSHFPAGMTLAGVDLSPDMLTLARDRAADLQLDVTPKEGDAKQLPFDDESFDTVVCRLGLCCISDERQAMAEMARVLRPRGPATSPGPGRIDQPGATARPTRRGADHAPCVRGLHDCLPLPLVAEAELIIEHSERLKAAGTVERVRAVKPPS